MPEEPLVTEGGLVAFLATLAQIFREIDTLHTVEADLQTLLRERLRYLVHGATHPLSEKDRESLYQLHGLLEVILQRADPYLIEIDRTYGFS